MFLITCAETGTPMLRGTRSITTVAQTPQGVELLATCTCGATVHLRRGVQVSHGPTPRRSTAPSGAAASTTGPPDAQVGAAGQSQMRGISV